jgi:hypothetical protein
MEWNDLSSMLGELTGTFGRQVPLVPCPLGAQAAFRWPKALPLMRFTAQQYAAPGYGNLFCLHTTAMAGRMRLATLVCTPNAGTAVPLLLADVMAMGKKRAVFVEYYDCTAAGAEVPALAKTAAAYAAMPDYPEKPAWYVGERAPYSLIKGGADEAALARMLADSVAAYAAECARHTETAAENRVKLNAFIDRMVRDGNPSSAAMSRALGKAQAEAFFRTRVMPAAFCAPK